MAGALDYFNANRRQSFADTQGMFDQATQRRAGGLLAGGDYTGAAGALYGGGLLSEGAQVQAMGQAQQDRAARSEAQKRAQEAEISAAEQAERLKFLAQGATVLLSIPAEQRAQAYAQSIAPALKAMGADDATIQQAGSQLDDTSLQTFSGQVSKALEQFTLAPGSKRFDATGKLVAEAPFAPQYKEVSPGEKIVAVGGEPVSGGVQEVVNSILGEGAKITSARRSLERNAAVGGAQNSYHLKGQAYDIVPPAGMSMADLEKRLRNSGADFAELINEGDHIHVAWNDRASGGGRVVADGGPAPAKERAPPAGYQWTADGSLTFIPGGPADPATSAGTRNLRPIPSQAQSGIRANRSTLEKIDKAIAAIRNQPRAMGAKNYLGDAINQRLDPQGVTVRALVSDIGSQKIHDRSGAAVTAAEQPRLMPFIPQVTDTPEAAVEKLMNLRAEYAAAVDETESFYSPDNGYRSLSVAAPRQAVTAPSTSPAARAQQRSGAPAIGEVRKGYRYKGGNPADPKSWVKAQ